MNLGIIGRARHGKDTAGKWFTEQRGYRRLAFADALKEAALKVDPVTFVSVTGCEMRLSEEVAADGWERAKGNPEVRRFLQELGASMRAVDPEIWVRPVLRQAIELNEIGKPVVVTDVRYRNEAESLVRSGFRLLHINRPGVPHLTHESEGALGPEDAHYMVQNDGTIDDLHARLDVIYDEVWAMESSRQALCH